MQKYYFSFGQAHKHRIGDKLFDKDVIAVVEAEDASAASVRMHEVFGTKWGSLYHKEPTMSYYHRGFLKLEDTDVKSLMVSQEYLGDGVYIEDIGHALLLTTQNGISVTNEIHIGFQEWEALKRYVEQVEEIRRG